MESSNLKNFEERKHSRAQHTYKLDERNRASQSTPYNQNSWNYDEENTPGMRSIELKDMPLDMALGAAASGSMKESSIQNHYISSSGGGAGSRPYQQNAYSNLNMPADSSAPTRKFLGTNSIKGSQQMSQRESDAMFAAAEAESTLKQTAVRDLNKINVSMSLSNADNDSTYLRKDKFKSRIGGMANAESAALTVAGSRLAKGEANSAGAGSLNND
jgi:hypothetical protein